MLRESREDEHEMEALEHSVIRVADFPLALFRGFLLPID